MSRAQQVNQTKAAIDKQVDTLIIARWVIPVVPANQLLENHAVAIRDGRIVAVLPTSEARQAFEAEEELQLPSHLLIPGLINSHTHAAMSLLRGIADDHPLQPWLEQHIWPAEQKHVNAEFVEAGSKLAIAEMISSGTTCFADMYFFPEATAAAAVLITGLVLLVDYSLSAPSQALLTEFNDTSLCYPVWDQAGLYDQNSASIESVWPRN